MTDYTTKIKEIFCALGSINVLVNEEKMVLIYVGGLAPRYGPIRIAICARETPSLFFNLQSMLIVEENHTNLLRSMHDILKHPTFVNVKSYTMITIDTIILKTKILVQLHIM